MLFLDLLRCNAFIDTIEIRLDLKVVIYLFVLFIYILRFASRTFDVMNVFCNSIIKKASDSDTFC